MTRPEPAPHDEEELGSIHKLLLRLDLATEVLEGLDQLGLDTRVEVEALVDKLERQIADPHSHAD